MFKTIELKADRHPTAELEGMLCYFGRHYLAFFFNVALGEWQCFNDEVVTNVGADWSCVVAYCLAAHYHPLLLFYTTSTKTTSFEVDIPELLQFTIGDIVVPASPSPTSFKAVSA